MYKNTMKELAMYDNWKRARDRHDAYSIYRIYKSPSNAKIRAWQYHKEQAAKLDASEPVITSGNCHFFSVAYTYKPIGQPQRLIYATGMNTYDFEIGYNARGYMSIKDLSDNELINLQQYHFIQFDQLVSIKELTNIYQGVLFTPKEVESMNKNYRIEV